MPRDWMTPAINGLADQFASVSTPRVAALPSTQAYTPPPIADLPRVTTDPNYYTNVAWDPSMGVSTPAYELGARHAVVGAEPDFPTMPTGEIGGSVGTAGGNWATLDGMNDKIAAAASQTGTPANLIKAMLGREGAFGTDKNVVGLRGERVYAFNGIFESTAQSYGIDFDKMTHDDAYAIWAMGKVLAGIKSTNNLSTWDDTAAYYFAGPNYKNPGWADEVGNTVADYTNGPTGVLTNWHKLDGPGGGTGMDTGSSIIARAKEFVGVPYVWGSLPGANADPWQTGWDCSSFVNYLDDKYGTNEIPAGSHYQYQDSVKKGLINMDPSTMQPGDLLFWNTGDHSGGGGELNDASHVSLYIGNGQMVHAANPGAGTIISSVADYMKMYGYMGARKMSWSGAGGPSTNPYTDRWGPDQAGWGRWR